MAYHEVSRSVTTAPRALTRAKARGRIINTIAGPYELSRPDPSVGGVVETEHVIYRCGHCRALAVTIAGDHASPPKKCGRCHQ